MDYPNANVRGRFQYKVNESERKVLTFLSRFFKKISVYAAASADYLLFGRATNLSADPYQFDDAISLIKNGTTSPELNFYRSNGTETLPTATILNDALGTIQSYRYYGGAWSGVGSSIYFYAGSTTGTGIAFTTTPDAGLRQASGAILPDGSWASGTGGDLAGATGGFLLIPTCATAPSAVPNSTDDRVAITYCLGDDKIYVYDGGWKKTAALT